MIQKNQQKVSQQHRNIWGNWKLICPGKKTSMMNSKFIIIIIIIIRLIQIFRLIQYQNIIQSYDLILELI